MEKINIVCKFLLLFSHFPSTKQKTNKTFFFSFHTTTINASFFFMILLKLMLFLFCQFIYLNFHHHCEKLDIYVTVRQVFIKKKNVHMLLLIFKKNQNINSQVIAYKVIKILQRIFLFKFNLFISQYCCSIANTNYQVNILIIKTFCNTLQKANISLAKYKLLRNYCLTKCFLHKNKFQSQKIPFKNL